jgi:hypothetical protein
LEVGEKFAGTPADIAQQAVMVLRQQKVIA